MSESGAVRRKKFDVCCFFFFKQKTAYEVCGRDWSSDVCSSDLAIINELSSAWPPRVVSWFARALAARAFNMDVGGGDRKSVVSGKRVDLGGRRIIKKKKIYIYIYYACVHHHEHTTATHNRTPHTSTQQELTEI